MSPRRIRIVRFRDMVFNDDTRPTEWSSGAAALILGIWMWYFYLPPSVPTALAIWKYLGPTAMAIMFTILGLAQLAAAGTKWVGLRRLTAMTTGVVWMYTLVVYWITSRDSLVTPLLGVFVLKLGWVSWRILHDKNVNGADRRLRRRYYGDDANVH